MAVPPAEIHTETATPRAARCRRIARLLPMLTAMVVAGMYAASAYAQSPTIPATTGASTPPTIWDHLGVHQIAGAAQHVCRSLKSTAAVDYAAKSVVSPMLAATGLKPGSAPTSFGPPGNQPAGAPVSGAAPADTAAGPEGGDAGAGAEASGGTTAGDAAATAADEAAAAAIAAATADASSVAAAIAPEVDPANELVKVKAIRFLARQDCICYPEVVDALLSSLDDCSEVVRYEALRALRTGCARGGNCASCGGHRFPGDPGANGYTCQCQVKVIKRLSDLLLDRDVRGHLKERSERVRNLARMMIVECVNSTPVAAGGPTPGLEAEPDPPLPVRLR